MADIKREIERKFEFTPAGRKQQRPPQPPDLTGTGPIAAVRDRGTVRLDAVYYDTPDQRLAADGLTLRRRTGGEDAGWHLKLPVAPGVRDEVRAPLADTVPRSLDALLRSRVRGAGLEPQVTLRSERQVSHLLDADGTLLAELSRDQVRAERGAAVAEWTEVEVELADDGDPALLDAVEKRFRKAGLRVSDAPSKLARALAETGAEPPPRPGPGPADGTAGAHVLAYLREQLDALVAQDPAVRRDLPDSVHQMRVATRRLRSAFATYRRVLERAATDPLREELRWLAAELGADRDREVLFERLRAGLAELPRGLRLGPVTSRLRTWNTTRRSSTRRRAVAALDSARYLALLDALDALLADPPLRPAAARPAARTLPKAVLRDWDRLADRVGTALALDPGEDRDLALHEARKAAKRARYAAEAAAPALGNPARRLARAAKGVQTLLGDHRDGVVARTALHGLAVQATDAGESAFSWGVLYAREEALSARHEQQLPDIWAQASDPGLRASVK
ncbi:CYTH and CHAD domain-containing protein [Streptomyces sp. NBC_00249]|uniref:CYTH and CHAD domain-containing protein n=1 Tax=Streptomyces sp. NBC_00249 TaxID=2975690 RepID=UPI002258B369|nr:CYTH and CHAD domain-containing protein [Streptomyces sp. NBC_00249]MCX5198190.1 CYTH and CHAD domain-containing protein [Streptomyces sp. NBC_00249]